MGGERLRTPSYVSLLRIRPRPLAWAVSAYMHVRFGQRPGPAPSEATRALQLEVQGEHLDRPFDRLPGIMSAGHISGVEARLAKGLGRFTANVKSVDAKGHDGGSLR